MPASYSKAYWRFDRDETSRVSTERNAHRQPEADGDSPVAGLGRVPRIDEAANGRPTASQLRSTIDRGAARDKVASLDPAAAPLGTDDEAAGAPPTPEQVEMAMRHEARRQPVEPQGGWGPKAGSGFWIAVAAGAGVLAIMLAATWP
ncbi:MAG: hypothetical protein AB7F78_14220 [Hyphomicrobiaceae bacterium]